jgi:hypothetical protein
VAPAIRVRNHTVIAAISLLYFDIKITEPDEEFISQRKGSKKKKTGPKGVTRDIFCTFLIHLFEHLPFSNSSTTFTLLFDNALIYLGDIQETIFQAGHAQDASPPCRLNTPNHCIIKRWHLRISKHT